LDAITSTFDMSSGKREAKKSVNFAAKDEVFFSASSRGWTPALKKITAYRNPEERVPECVAPPSTLSRPNHEGLFRFP
jgi:hypothetical protein